MTNPNAGMTDSDSAQRRRLLQALGLGLASGSALLVNTLAVTPAWAQAVSSHSKGAATAKALDWSALELAARGQKVYFNAWAGSDKINAYLQWAAGQVKNRYGVELIHVKINDAADVVKRVRTERAAQQGDKRADKQADNGTVDLVWINGENFAAMKGEKLLLQFAHNLPYSRYVDTKGKPTTLLDFSVPTEGFESPWGMAQLTFYADSKRLRNLPQNAQALLALARSQPGRITYPRPPQFHGTTFVKQMLLETANDQSVFQRSFQEQAGQFATLTQPLWAYLDALHPHLWRGGKQFAASNDVMRQMLADGELLLNLTFNPNEAANEIASKRLPASVVSWQFSKGTLGNTHFVAIPINARAKAGAQVVANFLLSPEAQARKADIAVWGDPTVLNIAQLPKAQAALFTTRPAPGQVLKPAPVWPEPHASWVAAIEAEWTKRYGA